MSNMTDNKTRTAGLRVRLTDAELAELTDAARDHCIPVSSWMRLAALKYTRDLLQFPATALREEP